MTLTTAHHTARLHVIWLTDDQGRPDQDAENHPEKFEYIAASGDQSRASISVMDFVVLAVGDRAEIRWIQPVQRVVWRDEDSTEDGTGVRLATIHLGEPLPGMRRGDNLPPQLRVGDGYTHGALLSDFVSLYLGLGQFEFPVLLEDGTVPLCQLDLPAEATTEVLAALLHKP
jgi:hypothetical protein